MRMIHPDRDLSPLNSNISFLSSQVSQFLQHLISKDHFKLCATSQLYRINDDSVLRSDSGVKQLYRRWKSHYSDPFLFSSDSVSVKLILLLDITYSMDMKIIIMSPVHLFCPWLCKKTVPLLLSIEIHYLIQLTYCVHPCFYIVLIFKKFLHVITSVINLCNYICNYTVDPSPTFKYLSEK